MGERIPSQVFVTTMRIAQIIDDLNYGGAEQVVVSLAHGLRCRGHDVTMICLREIGSKPVDIAQARAAGVEFVELHKPEGFHLPTLRKLIAEFRQRRFDVVHTHNHLVHHYGAVAARVAGVPVVLNTLHGTSSLQKSSLATKILYVLSGLLGDRVVAVCSQVGVALKQYFRFPRRWIGTVDNGIDLDKFLSIPRSEGSEAVVFGIVGRLDPVKDHRNLLEAFALLIREYPEVRLRVLGDGSLMSQLVALAQSLHISEAVTFEGFSLDTRGFLGRIDAYVLSSRSEGLPLSLLEAMGAGLPIVATTVGEVPAIVSKAECGWLAEPGNPEHLAAAMKRLLTCDDRIGVGARGRLRARDHYSVERMISEYEALYGQLRS